ncbi:MAG TPA: hypothetical protein P5089_02095 [Candidatus Portnoybacteria bacterium]|nr:hypothetical protein [Candidatus Portnoybacteria bacterium]
MADLYREPIDSAAETPVEPPSPLNPAESEIAELEKQLAQKRAMLGKEKGESLEKIVGAEKPATSSASSPSQSQPAAAPVVAVPPKTAADEYKGLEKNQQLKSLVDLAFQKGINYAADVAKEMDSAYLMDEFHDTLVDKLHKELVEKGKLEEI